MREQKGWGARGVIRVYCKKDRATERTEKQERPYRHRALLHKRKEKVHNRRSIPDCSREVHSRDRGVVETLRLSETPFSHVFDRSVIGVLRTADKRPAGEPIGSYSSFHIHHFVV